MRELGGGIKKLENKICGKYKKKKEKHWKIKEKAAVRRERK